MFFNRSSSTLAKIHLPNSLRPGQLHFSTFCFYPIRAHYSPSSLLPLGLNRSQMLQYERQLRSVIFFFFLSSHCYRKWAPLEKGKRNERRKVIGFKGAQRGKNKNYLHHLVYLITHVCKVPNTEPHSCIGTQHMRVSLPRSCLSSLLNGNVFDLDFFTSFCKVGKMEPAKEER